MTKIEKTLKKLNELYRFYQKIPKVRESEKNYKARQKNKKKL